MIEKKDRTLTGYWERTRYQLENMEHLFSGLAQSYVEEEIPVQQRKRELIQKIWEENEEQYCNRCSNKNMCQKRVPKKLLQQGYLKKENIFSYLTCHGGERMIQTLNYRYQDGILKLMAEKQLHLHKSYLERQYRTAAKLLREEIQKIEPEIQIESVEKNLKKCGKIYGVEIQECWQVKKKGFLEVHCYLRIKRGEKTAKYVAQVLSVFLRRKLQPQAGSRNIAGNRFVWMTFVEIPEFYVLTGAIQKKKQGEILCGEQFYIKELRNHQMAAVICDGLGTGREAFRDSRRIIERLELLLESGETLEMALELINNSFCFVAEQERYVTLDLVLLDLYTGIGEFVKLGAAETFLLREGGVESLSGDEPPVGLAQNRTCITRKKLNHGEWMILLSDGVIDGFQGKDSFLDFLLKYKKTSPQVLCQDIIERTSNEKDDCTVIVIGVWNR